MNSFKITTIAMFFVAVSFSLFATGNETSMLRCNTRVYDNNFRQHGSSIRQLKNKLLTYEKENVKTIEFKVSGLCEMCEKRIEDAALIKGVKMADWNKEAQKIKVVYRPDKTNKQAIHQAIAKAGHDTEKQKAPAEAYNKLHDCCKYRDGQAVH